MNIRGYGIDNWPAHEHYLRTAGGSELVELPVATTRLLGRTLPLGGGGYFRLLPYGLIRLGIRYLQACGRSAVVYCHPYEFDPDAFAESKLPVPWRMRLHQELGRRRFAHKIGALLDEFPFVAMRGLLPPHVRSA